VSYNIYLNNKNESQLSPVYYELIQHLWEKNRTKSYSPYNFMNKINEMNTLFKLGQAGDSKDFIIYILEQLHKELNASVIEKNSNNSKINKPYDQYDKENTFNYFFNNFQKNCSIISDIFFGVNQTTNTCLNCKKNYNSQNLANPICYNYEIFNCIIFPLEEIRKTKYNSSQNNYLNQINNNIISIYDCFSYNQRDDLFTGQNQNFCNKCKQTFDSIYNLSIYISPNVLILILNRGKDNMYDVKLNFNETIDITNYVIMKDKPRIIYDLYGVITHHGESGPNAHFIASCKSPIDNKWYRYNDAIVTSINNIQSDVINFGKPYILFYKKC
jgi:ubiquitin C-terminal hydrolase